MMLEIGTTAIDFTLPDEQGNLISLHSFKGKKIVLYFYPKDNTHGCSKQACALNAAYDVYKRNDIIVIGIRNTICLLFYYPMRNIKSLKHMMSGKRKNYMVKPIWALRAVPM